MPYDRGDWHYGGDYPAGLPDENGSTHIGQYMAWAFEQGMAGKLHREESAKALKQLARREITGRDFLIEYCDEKFTDEDLNDLGNAFTTDYYDEKSAFAQAYGNYIQDYCDVFNRYAEEQGFEYASTYHVENTWENYDRLKPMLDQRFAEWKTWSADPANCQLDPKTQFLAACAEAGKFLSAHGFKANKAGDVWKKTLADKDTVFTVTFVRGLYNTRTDVRLMIFVAIASKQLKKWVAEKTGLTARDTLHYHSLILYTSLRVPNSDEDEWNVSSTQAAASLKMICGSFEHNLLPLIELFSDRPRAIEHLAARGSAFPGISYLSSLPLAFMLCFGTPEQAQRFLTHFVLNIRKESSDVFYQTFAALQENPTIDWQRFAYGAEFEMKLAFVCGLALPDR